MTKWPKRKASPKRSMRSSLTIMPSNGWRQRLRRAGGRSRSRSPPHLRNSESVVGRLHDWARGPASAPSVKSHCVRLVVDARRVENSVDVFAARLAKIGGDRIGSNGGHRDLLKALPNMGIDVAHMITPVPAGGQFQYCILPYENLRWRCALDTPKFIRLMGLRRS